MTWPNVALGDVATIERQGIDPTDIPVGTRYVGLENIAAGQEITSWQVVGEVAVASTKFRFDPGHVLYGKLRPNLGKIARPTFSGVCSTDILPIRPGPKLDRSYLRHFLVQPSMIDFAASRAAGANLPRLSPRVLATFQVPLPPLEEQRRIAAILDQADALRAKRRQTLVHIESLIASMFDDLLTQSHAWPMRRLVELCDAIVDCPHSTPKWSEIGQVCLRTSNLTKGGWDWTECRYVSDADYKQRSQRDEARPGDIILSREGTVGVAAIVEPGMRVCMGQRLVQVRVRRDVLHPQFALRFLLHALDPVRIEHLMVGSTARHLNVRDLKALPVPLAPVALQRAFADCMALVSAQRSSAVRAIANEHELLASLQTRAFTGGL